MQHEVTRDIPAGVAAEASNGSTPRWLDQWRAWTDRQQRSRDVCNDSIGESVTNQKCFLCRGQHIKYLRFADLPRDIRQCIKSVNYSNMIQLEGALKRLALSRVETEPWRRNIEYNQIINIIRSKCISFKLFRKRIGLGKH